MTTSIKEVKKRHQASLFKLPGVVSVGVGLDETGRRAIIVGLDGPQRDTEKRLPASLEGVPVVVQVVGTIKPL